MLDTPFRSTDSAVSLGDDNVAGPANEVTETKHNNKSDAVTEGEGFSEQGNIAADNDKKKNSLGDARENYKFDVSIRKVDLSHLPSQR